MPITTLRKLISISMIASMVFGDVAGFAADFSPHAATLAVAPAGVRDTVREARAMAYRKLFDERLAPANGGKIAFDMLLERLSKKIRFAVAPSVRFSIADLGAKFIEANQELVEKGNRLVHEEFASHGRISAGVEDRLCCNCF